jgi:hypothetical protein
MAIPIAPAPFRWHRSQIAETDANDHASAACYRSLKDSRIVAMIVAEFEFRNVAQ